AEVRSSRCDHAADEPGPGNGIAHRRDPHPRRPDRQDPRHHLAGRPHDPLRLHAAPLALSVCPLPRRGRDARLARHQPHADRRADADGRHPPRRQLRGRAGWGRRPPHRVLHVRAPARPLPVRDLRGGAIRPGTRPRPPRPPGGVQMIVATSPFIAGHRVTETKGQVFGLVVRSRGFSGNLIAGLRSLGGGEIKEYTELLEDTRRQALDRLVKNATLMGANAVISMRFDSSEMATTMTEIVAYGTAFVVVADATAPQASE